MRYLQDRDYLGALLQSNRHYNRFFRKYFPRGDVFHPLSHYLLHLSAPLERRAQDVVQRRFSAHTIGIQMRLLKSDFAFFTGWKPPPSVEAYCSAAKAVSAASDSAEDARYFVTADDPAAYAEVARILGPEKVIYGANRREAGNLTVAGNPGTEGSAVLDLRLLSMCSDVVISSGSSFGGVAAAWGGMIPVYMVYGEHADLKNPYFWRALSSEPCFFGARAFLAQANSDVVTDFKRTGFWLQYTQCH